MTPRTDALYFPLGKEHTTARTPSFMGGYDHAAILETELIAAYAETGVLRKDAERYRWSITSEQNAIDLMMFVRSAGNRSDEWIGGQVDADRTGRISRPESADYLVR